MPAPDAHAATRCLCAERDLLGDDEPCAGFGSISDELCEQAERESVAAGTWPPDPPGVSRQWTVFSRLKDYPWVEWLTFFTEADGIEALQDFRVQYPHYEIELRKITSTTERVDV